MKLWLCAAAVCLTLLSGCGRSAEEQNRPVTLVARESGSGTRFFFNSIVGINRDSGSSRQDDTAPSALVMTSTNGVIMRVARDPGAIGYVSAGSVRSRVKILSVNGVYPTAGNIRNGTYKLTRPVYLTFRRDHQDPAVQELVDFMKSNEGRDIFLANGFVPPSDGTGPFQPRLASGHAVIVGASSLGSVMQQMIDAYTAHAPGVRIDLQELDSLMGVNLVRTGTVMAGLTSRELTASEVAEGIDDVLLARQAVAVIVNRENPLDNISSDALRDMYTGHIVRWPAKGGAL